jgi:hypothetical protein
LPLLNCWKNKCITLYILAFAVKNFLQNDEQQIANCNPNCCIADIGDEIPLNSLLSKFKYYQMHASSEALADNKTANPTLRK